MIRLASCPVSFLHTRRRVSPGLTLSCFHHICFLRVVAFFLNMPACACKSSAHHTTHHAHIASAHTRPFLSHPHPSHFHQTKHVPAAFSMFSSVTQLARATWTFSCSTSLTLSTLLITAASLSTSSRLSYLLDFSYTTERERRGACEWSDGVRKYEERGIDHGLSTRHNTRIIVPFQRGDRGEARGRGLTSRRAS